MKTRKQKIYKLIEVDKQLIIDAKNHNDNATMQIIELLKPITCGFLKRFPKDWYEDGYQSAIVGILIAIQRFDFKRSDETNFVPFARNFIANEINTLRRTCIEAAVKIPHNVRVAYMENKKNNKNDTIQLTNGMKIRVSDIDRFKDFVYLSEFDNNQDT